MAKRTRRVNNTNTTTEISDLKSKIDNLELLQSYTSNSSPRNLTTNQSQGTLGVLSRDAEYYKRNEMYSDTFTREMVKVIIVRSIGTTHDNIAPFKLSIKNAAEVNDSIKDEVQEDLDRLTKIISKDLMDVALDSQFYGDGYSKIEYDDTGVTKLLNNISTKSFNITPVVTNKGKIVAYEVGSGFEMYANTNSFGRKVNSRDYVAPINIARMNSTGNGILKITLDQLSNPDIVNVFNSNESAYEDTVYGGVMEDVYNDFINFQWALKSLSSARINSSVIERFIIHSLNSVNGDEKEALKNALEKQMRTTMQSIKDKATSKSPDILIANHIIPTTKDGTGGISIQESNISPQGLQTIEDIMIHIRKFIGAIGFNIEMTPFAGMSVGGGEKDGVVQNSLQMDAQGSQVREAIRGYILDIVRVHFLSKYNLEIETDFIDVSFVSVLNQAKMNAEQQRMEALQNTQQIFGVIEQLKSMELEDNEVNRLMLSDILSELTSQTSKNVDNQVNAFIEIILTKPKEEEL